jgi:hypothetical protein
MKSTEACSLILVLLSSSAALAATRPNVSVTPGVLCTSSSPDFHGFDYPEHIARCSRSIQQPEKLEVAKLYGDIPESQWASFEFDHLIPLCAGGANDVKNLWPQPIAEAHLKDVLENQICIEMKAGTLKQTDAVQRVHDWFASHGIAAGIFADASTALDSGKVSCVSNSRSGSSQIGVTFDQKGDNELERIVATLKGPEKDNELISSKGAVLSGKISRSKNGVLKGLFLYAVRDDKDRFDFYVPDTTTLVRGETFTAYFKVSFEGTYPNLNELTCSF